MGLFIPDLVRGYKEVVATRLFLASDKPGLLKKP